MTDGHVFWITSRAAGILALLLSTAAVCVGLAMSGRRVRRRGPDLRATHEALALATMIAIAVRTRLDSGGLAKGLVAETLRGRASYAVDCAGDLPAGGAERRVEVASPFDGTVLHTFRLRDAGVATSGIGRRSWLDPGGRPAHHLLDPATGSPAFTGVVQATAVAPTELEAEIRAKAAVLSGPAGAPAWLPHGGVVVGDDGFHHAYPALSNDPRGLPPCPAACAAS